MLSRIWSDSIWLPSNITWEDISNGPGKTVVYAEAKDFWAIVPLVILLLALRFFFERYVFFPLGIYLNVNNATVKKVTPNVKMSPFKRKNAAALAKQLDLTERQVERWWRRRHRQDKPATLVKFSECMWRGCSILLNVSVGMFTVWGQDWAWDPNKLFKKYPHQGITPGIWRYYMLTSAFYTSITVTYFHDVRRKDFWQMLWHHIFTLLLLFMSWTTQYFRVGCLVMILHDSGDIVLEFGKAFKYAKYHRTVDCLLAVFCVLWVGCRLVVYPFVILHASYSQRSKSPVTRLMGYLLVFVLCLTLYWTWLLVQTVVKAIHCGGMGNDIRSSESEDSDMSNISNAPIRTSVNRKIKPCFPSPVPKTYLHSQKGVESW